MTKCVVKRNCFVNPGVKFVKAVQFNSSIVTVATLTLSNSFANTVVTVDAVFYISANTQTVTSNKYTTNGAGNFKISVPANTDAVQIYVKVVKCNQCFSFTVPASLVK